MTLKDETKHVVRLYRHITEPYKYIFIGTQSKYLQQALKVEKLKKILDAS